MALALEAGQNAEPQVVKGSPQFNWVPPLLQELSTTITASWPTGTNQGASYNL